MNKPTGQTLFDEVADVCVGVLRVPREKVVEGARLVEDLDVDSLFVVQLAMALEDKFGFDMPEEELPALKSVGDIVNYVRAKTGAA